MASNLVKRLFQASDRDSRVSGAFCHNDKRIFKPLSKCFYMKGIFFFSAFCCFTAYKLQQAVSIKHSQGFLTDPFSKIFMRVNVVQNISRMIYGELSEGLSVKIIHSEGVSKGRTNFFYMTI